MPVVYERGAFRNYGGGSFAVKEEDWYKIYLKWAATGRIKQAERPCHTNDWVGRIYLK